MERRPSSICLSPVSHSSIRHRSSGFNNAGAKQTSGGYSPNQFEDRSSAARVLYSPRYGHSEATVQVQGTRTDALEDLYRAIQDDFSCPAERKSHTPEGRFPPSLGTTAPLRIRPQSVSLREPEIPRELEESQERLSTIALIPQPDSYGPTRSASRVSNVTRLPTPDFMKEGRSRSFRSVFSSKCSVVSPQASEYRAEEKSWPSRPSSPMKMGRDSSSTLTLGHSASASIHSASASIHSKCSLLPDNFTRKWPQPRPSAKGGSKNDASALGLALLEEEGVGLGMDRVGRWTANKWCLLASVITVFIYGLVGMTCAISTWFRTWVHADVMYVADYDVLVLITLASSILLLTSAVGTTGTLLNSRPILAIYALLLWPALISILSIGYISYRRSALALDRKLNLAWSQWYTPVGRLIVQDSLRCCGYYNSLHDATPSKRCYSRTPLPGCKDKLFHFEQANLGMIWSAAFSLVPLHIANIFVALLCANHVTRRFGKGITPKGYRLTGADVRAGSEKMSAGPVLIPELCRAPSSGVFREDRVYGYRQIRSKEVGLGFVAPR